MNARQQGLYNKFNVTRTDGRDAPGEKHHGAEYFVLDLSDDPFAIPAISAYAKACHNEYPQLAVELQSKVTAHILANSDFVQVPETTLPGGLVVPTFMASRYLCTVIDGKAVSSQFETPTVRINYHDANAACEAAGAKLIRETQELALAWNIYNQDANWTGGKVGEGRLFQGLHDDTVDGAQPNAYESTDENERRWFVLSNGERIYDAAGHLFTWVFDDVQGDENGLIAKPFTAESPSISTCPLPSMKQGVGWMPSLPCDWSGRALVRGGCWYSGSDAGVFRLGLGWPDLGNGNIGFRCTK